VQDDGMTVRIGILGAAKIAPAAVIGPARRSAEAEVVAVAARDRERAAKFAAKHRIPRVADDYPALLADPDVDAVYVPLPNGLHGRWTLAALAAGKHVLCEKPFTANAEEARQVAAAAAESGLVVQEAFHYRHHPLARRLREVVASGELGALRSVSAAVCFPLPMRGDIRFRYDLAGGALMDAGCYAVHLVRTLTGLEPEVVAAQAKLRNPEVDRAIRAQLSFPDGCTGEVRASLWSADLLRLSATAVGDRGELRVVNPILPSLPHRLRVRTANGTRTERFPHRSSYDYQLDAFTGSVLRGEPVLTSATDAVATMTVLDSVYTAAGLPLRRPA
jgi:predicted dehydrogenase